MDILIMERIGGLDCWKMHVRVADQKFLIERTSNMDVLIMDFLEDRGYHLVCVENCGGEINCGRDRRLFFKQEVNCTPPRPFIPVLAPPKCPLGPMETARPVLLTEPHKPDGPIGETLIP